MSRERSPRSIFPRLPDARHCLTALGGLLAVGVAHGAPLAGGDTTGVANAVPKAASTSAPSVLTLQLTGVSVVQAAVAQGSTPVENPLTTAAGAQVTHYGYLNDGPMVAPPGTLLEATKTEPDKNTYLVLQGQHGPDAAYDYGAHFLFQGHESGASDAGVKKGCITRINLDADAAHRVTVFATTDENGAFLPTIDGSVFYPFSQHLLFTAENGPAGGVWQSTVDWPPVVRDISGVTGRGSYEGAQADSSGNLWIVEDIGGPAGAVNKQAKQPNSFVYRLVPATPADLEAGGRLQVLQVTSLANLGQPIVFHAGQADADILSQDMLDLHTYGNQFATGWVTIHDTAVDGFAPFDANALAKAAGGTPFKRPENGQFRPTSQFREFFITETGDTNANTQAGAAYGGFGGLYRLVQDSPAADTGTLSEFYRGDVAHTGLDNLSFLTATLLLSGEDRGDTLHTQQNALDSLFQFDTTVDYGAVDAPAPVRVVAEGRDVPATFDSAALGSSGFQNEGDNEITGIHVSDGDSTVAGLIGTKEPRPFRRGWRIFWTQQHGDNVTWAIVKS